MRTGALVLLVLASLSASFAACGRSARREPIDGPPSARWEDGEALFTELRCVACHAASDGRTRELAVHVAPNLDRAGARLRPEWIERFLIDPQGTQPGVAMPDMLAGLADDARRETARDLTHFLASRGGPIDLSAETMPAPDVDEGRRLYHSTGCVACHLPIDFPDDLEQPLWTFTGFDGEVSSFDLAGPSLGHLPAKTAPRALAQQLLDPLSVRPDGTMPSLRLTPDEAERIARYLATSEVHVGGTGFVHGPGLRWAYYEGNLDTEGAFSELAAVRTGVTPTIDELPEHREEAFGLSFEGFVTLDEPRRILFTLGSDDGSRLWIDEELVLDHWGDHGFTERAAEVELAAGDHQLRVHYYERGGDDALELSWSGDGLVDGPLPPERLWHWIAPERRSGRAFALDDRRIARGRAAYESLGCVACHPLSDTEGLTAPRTPALDDLDPDDGCLDPGRERRGVPRFALAADDRAALADFVAAPELGSWPLDPELALHRELDRLDCFACHERDGEGGPELDRRAWFTVRGEVDLGEEGRVPPKLDGVGGKLRREWLARVLDDQPVVRPYLVTRMPEFGAANVAPLTDLFTVVDAEDGDLDEPPFSPEAVEDGRELASVGAMACIQCHLFDDHPPIGIPAVDLTSVHERIRPGWFRKLLLDPRSIGMNSRMPVFWQGDKSPVTDVADGDPVRQTEALWTWLSLGTAAPLPAGLVVPDEAYELLPTDRPVLCGVFMAGVSPRTTVVGFPERVHCAFDVQGSRMAKVWRGRFFNARGTWHGRAGVLESPPSDDVYDLPDGVAFASLARPDTPWPTGDEGSRALGRRMDPEGRPTFRYACGLVEIEETPIPVLDAEGGRMIRRFHLEGVGLRGLVFRAAVGDTIEPSGDGTWSVDGARVELRVPDSARVEVRGEGRRELRVHFTDRAPTDMEVELWW